MKAEIIAIVLAGIVTGDLCAQVRPARKGGLLEQDPDVVYLDHDFDEEFILKVVKDAPVFSDKDGRRRLGKIKANQKVKLEAMTNRAYKVRGKGTRNTIAGWVAPWAFEPTWKDDDFIGNLKKLYTRQQEVKKLVAAGEIAVGMTLDEVQKSLGKPSKTTVRRTGKGRSGTWEYIDYDDVKYYTTVRDPYTGQFYRTLSHVVREEKGHTKVEFKDDVVMAIEESEDREGGGNVRIIVPPMVFGW
jgi:hypothetical protein